MSTIFVFALTPWIDAVGITNVFVTISVIGLVVLLAVGLFIVKGKSYRRMTAGKYRYYAERQFDTRNLKV